MTARPLTSDDDPACPPPEVIEAWAKDCRCCLECGDVPCGGVMAGGLCDRYCRCDDDRDEEYDDDE